MAECLGFKKDYSRRTSPSVEVLIKSTVASHLPKSHFPELVTQPSPESMREGIPGVEVH